MAAGEEGDTELRDLVAQTLETQGVLGKIRAQLRASVFLALEQDKKDKPSQATSSRFNSFMQTEDGRITAGLVREFLQFFELDFSCSVFDPETNVLRYYNGREKLATDTGLSSTTDSPLLLQLLKRARTTPTPLLPIHTDVPPSDQSTSLLQHAPLPPIASKTTPISLPAAMPTSDIILTQSNRQQSSATGITGTAGLTGSLTSSTGKAVTCTGSTVTPVTLTSVLSSSTHASIPPSTIPSLPIPSTTTDAHSSVSKASTLVTAASGGGGLDLITSLGLTSSSSPVASGGQSSLTAFLEQNGADRRTGKSSKIDDESDDDDTVSSQKWMETTDHSLSQSTLADEEFDHTEQVQ